MKRKNLIRLFQLISLVLLLVNCKPKPTADGIHDYQTFKSNFVDPPADYRTAPLWDWNDKITEEGIDFHMKKFKEGGLGGVFVHPRPGLLTEYISEDWHHLFDYTVRKGKELGMKVWIYDENSYPSGFAGGHVAAQMPESYNHGTGYSCEKQEILKLDTAKYDIIIRLENNLFTDITKTKDQYVGSKGEFYLFKKTYSKKSYWLGNFPYVDLLHKGVTEKFIEITMKGYEKYDRDEFGKTLVGIFTDEPNLEAAIGKDTDLRWTSDLFDEFQKRWGYDLKITLPSLVYEVGDWKKVRHDYYELLSELFVERFIKPYAQYCESVGLQLTGHFWEHGWPMPTDGFDEASCYIYQQQPGVDMLGNVYTPNGQGAQFGNTRAVRELQSAANQAGHRRTLSETYGGAGWEIPFSNLKKLVDWEVVLGVNFVNQHLSYYTIKGVRKFDYPPSFTYHEPWWENYKMMGDYIGRISMATSSGEQINKTLVLQPNTTSWMYFARKIKHTTPEIIKRDFRLFVYDLERNHYQYDLGSENVLKVIGSVNKNTLVVGKRSYNLVVIPQTMQNIDLNTYKLLSEYLEKGGKILSFADSIPYLDGKESKSINALRSKYANQWSLAKEATEVSAKNLLSDPDFLIQESDPKAGELYFQRRIMEDGQMLFFVNSNNHHNATAKIKAKGKSLIKMDLLTGECFRLPTKSVDGQLTFEVTLSPIGSELYYLSNNNVGENPIPKVSSQEQVVAGNGDLTVHPDKENVLVLDYLDLKSRNIDLKEVYFMKGMHALFDSSGFKMGNPWQHKIQYKQDYIALDTFKVNSGFEVNYHFTIGENATKETIKNLSVVVERPELWDVLINGQKVEKGNEWWIDREFFKSPIGDKVQKGLNTLTLKAQKMSIYAELMPAYIVGNFVLNPLTKGFEISTGTLAKLGSWKSMGYPFYSQKVSYSQNFEAPKSNETYKLKLNKWNGIVAEIYVNKKKAGAIAYPPYELDLSKYIQSGNNMITVTVIGSLKNTFGYFYKDRERWINGPGDWDVAPDKAPNSAAYFLMDYGLEEPFNLIRSN